MYTHIGADEACGLSEGVGDSLQDSLLLIRRGYKTELDPDNVQRTALLRHAGAARFAFNWGIRRKQEIYAINQLPVTHIKIPSAIDLHRELNRLKKTDFPWMYEVSKCAPQEALRDLDDAFKRFFKGLGRYPKFKSKKHGIGSFTLTGAIKVSGDSIQLPRIGTVRLKERNYLPSDKHLLSVTVSERAGRWFVSVQVEEEIRVPENHGPIVGVDLGVANLATVSDGMVISNPKALRRSMRKLSHLHREVSKKKKGSNNWKKSVRKLARTHARISNIRKDAIHKVTTMLARTKSVIVVEDLNVSGMMKNHNLARAMSYVGMSEFGRQLEYKSQWYGSKIVIADRFFPSSKSCSGCGHIKDDLELSDRIFECDVCHLKIDRDLNASINLSRLAASSTESENACLRREVADRPAMDGRCPSMIQELNAIEGRMS